MKKFAVCSILLAVIAGVAAIFWGTGGGDTMSETEGAAAYLRVHIRANSNSETDQGVKYLVRDGVVEFLTPVLSDCAAKQAAVGAVEENLRMIERTAERILNDNGFFYGARASVRKEEFPTRVYEGVTLSAGVYDALIVELGAGEGDNWWCVVYPPLCFAAGNGNIVYKSKIAEIIHNFFNR